MSAARDTIPLTPILLDGDWAFDWLFVKSDGQTADPFPDASTFSLVFAAAGQDKPVTADVIEVTSSDFITLPASNDVGAAIPKASLATLGFRATRYNVELRRTGPGTVFEPLYVGSVQAFTGASQAAASGGATRFGRIPGAPGSATLIRGTDQVQVVRGDAAGAAATAAAASATAIAASAVRYDVAQTLTSAQQLQAKENLALDQVDNTSDANKPVSTAQQAAISQAQSNAEAYAVAKAGDTMVGPLTLQAKLRLGPGTPDTYLDGDGSQVWVQFASASRRLFSFRSYYQAAFYASGALVWSGDPTNATGGTIDTGLTRGAAGQVNVGNGAAGDASGTLAFAKANATSHVVTTGGFACGTGATQAGAAIGQVLVYTVGTQKMGMTTAGFYMANDQQIRWSSTTSSQGVVDTSISRISAGVVGIGNGAQSAAGTLRLSTLLNGPFTVATLPSPSASGPGAQTTVSDCANPTQAGQPVTGGGTTAKGVIVSGGVWTVD